MSYQWGRSDDAGRQSTGLPIYTLMLLPLALAAGIGMAVYQYQVWFTTLQRWYLTSYIASSYAPRKMMPTGKYQLVDLVGDRYITRPAKTYTHEEMEPWLRETVYAGQAAHQLTWWPLRAAGAVLLVGLCLTIRWDMRRLQRLREGTILRGGPRPLTVAEYTQQHREHDGIRIRVE